MRRSKAPSVVNKVNRLCNLNNSIEEHCSDPEDEQYSWGSGNGGTNQNKNKSKKVFNVVWREVSTRKHKIWKGDGTLEVSNDLTRVILKDETGKYMACSTKFNLNDLVPDFAMVIGSKEIEIQNEIIDEDQLFELRKRQAAGRMDQAMCSERKEEEEKKPKGGFVFQPILVLNPPKIKSELIENLSKEKQNLISNRIAEKKIKAEPHFQEQFSTNSNLQTSSSTALCQELMCFLLPSELQQSLFQNVAEYLTSSETHSLSLEEIKSLEIDQVLKDICNHPSLINHRTTTNKLIRFLLPSLPDWTEMGPFDSSKLEFVQYFLSDLKNLNSEVCTILAKDVNVLNMLQGLCDFMNIKCLRQETIAIHVINEFCLSESNLTRVLICSSQEVLSSSDLLPYCKKFIVFEDIVQSLNKRSIEISKDIIIYYLVTAFSIEELLLLDTYKNDNVINWLDELLNITNAEHGCCYIHSKIDCNCIKNADKNKSRSNVFKDWKHFDSPFDVQLLKSISMENTSHNVASIFYKN